eukprot:1149443-Pelagomonas_calceolata.AAC.3
MGHCCVRVNTSKKASRSCGRDPGHLELQCPWYLRVLQCVHGQFQLGNIIRGGSLVGIKWLQACIFRSWLLCAVMNVLYHVPHTVWLMVVCFQQHTPASAGFVVPECAS